MTTEKLSFRLKAGGKVQEKVTRRGLQSVDDAESEIMALARAYRRHGEVTVEHNAAGHWKRFALLCQWPLPNSEDRHDG